MFTMYVVVALVLSVLFVVFCVRETAIINLMVKYDRTVSPVVSLLEKKRLTKHQAFILAYNHRMNYLRTVETHLCDSQRVLAEMDVQHYVFNHLED